MSEGSVDDPSSARSSHFYRLLGINLASDIPLHVLRHSPVREAREADRRNAELVYELYGDVQQAARFGLSTPVYTSPFRDEMGSPALEIFALPDLDVLRLPDLADFHVERHRILLHRIGPDPGHVIELRFLGPVLAVWLERQGIPVLHGSAVAFNGAAIAFLGSKGQGKSFLAAELIRRGCSLVTDDMLATEASTARPVARPAYPLMRMEPAMARRFLGDRTELNRVHPRDDKRWVPVGHGSFGAFCEKPTPLHRIYILERLGDADRTPAVEISTIPPARAVIELVTHSFSPRMIAALGLEAARLSRLTAIATATSVRRLTYVTGDRHFDVVCRAVLDDLALG